jgi:hypothetical protein
MWLDWCWGRRGWRAARPAAEVATLQKTVFLFSPTIPYIYCPEPVLTNDRFWCSFGTQMAHKKPFRGVPPTGQLKEGR